MIRKPIDSGFDNIHGFMIPTRKKHSLAFEVSIGEDRQDHLRLTRSWWPRHNGQVIPKGRADRSPLLIIKWNYLDGCSFLARAGAERGFHTPASKEKPERRSFKGRFLSFIPEKFKFPF
jgi:hypothetical protein